MPADFAATLRAAIRAEGPIPLADYMARSNAQYYAHGDPLGADFATAPELAQVFGELIGLWAADLWDRAGRPQAALVELGPGRGTLMADALRAAAKAGFAPPVHLVESSPSLAAEQARRVPHALHHADIGTLPSGRALIVLANEFLDALPIRQLIRQGSAWRELMVGLVGREFAVLHGPPLADDGLPDAPDGAVLELRPAAEALVGGLARRIAAQGGALLFIDYGHLGPAFGDTLQAMRRGSALPLIAAPGEADLSAHVDFAPLIAAARGAGCAAFGPVPQGAFLTRLGIHARTAALARANPAAAPRLQAATLRLTEPAHMGALFKLLAVTAPGWPTPAGLA